VAKNYDVIVIGAGLNGLVAAAYLAKAGRSVLVAERRDTVGGAVGTSAISTNANSTDAGAEGFSAPSTFASAEDFHPQIVRDLALEKHGLRWLPGKGGTFVANGDSSLFANGNLSGAVSEKDAQAVRKLDAFMGRVANALEPALTKALPEVENLGPGTFWELLTLGMRLRKLGKDEMPEALRFLPMPVKDVMDDYLGTSKESEILKAALAGPALRASWLAPRSAGSALQMLLGRPAWRQGGLLSPPVFVEGGPGKLSEAVAAAARAAGAEIRTGCTVKSILTDDMDRACGVVLASGDDVDEIAAQQVVSNADPRTTLLRLLDPAVLDPEHLFAVKTIRSRGTVAIVRFALGDLPRFTGAPEGDDVLKGRVQLGATMDELEQAFDPIKYGEIPERFFVEMTIPSLVDSTLAPAGKHVAHCWVQYVPHALSEGTWDEKRDALGDAVVAQIERHAPGFSALVEHRDVTTPADLEERYGVSHLYHVEPALDQALYMRPIPGFYRHRTPIDRLYLCGPGTHPGGGVTGLNGKLAAERVLADK